MKCAFFKRQFFTKLKFSLTFATKKNYLIHLIVCLHLSITVPLAAILNIWTDESYSLNTTGKSLQYAISQAINFELQPPLYFALLNIWRSVNDSIFWARLFSIIATVLTIYLVALLSTRLIKTINPVWLVTIFSFNPFVIYQATEIRVYAFTILLSALLLLLFFAAYFEPKYQIKTRVIYLILAVLALYTQYYLACLLIANAIVLLVLRRWQSLKYYLLGMSLVAMSCIPLLFYISNQISGHTKDLDGSWQYQYFFITNIFNIIQKIQVLLSNFVGLSKPILIFSYLLVFLLLLGLLFVIDIRLITSNHVAIWTINITSIAFFIWVQVITHGFLLYRHTAGILIVSYLGLFLLLSLIKYSRIRNTIIISLIVITLGSNIYDLSVMYNKYPKLAKSGDWQRVAEYIINSEQPQQEILVFIPMAAESLSYYYEGINKIIPLPKEEDFKNYDLKDYALNNEAEISQALLSKRHDIWLVDDLQCGYLNVDYNCHILEDFVDKYYKIKNTKNFYKSRVRFLERK